MSMHMIRGIQIHGNSKKKLTPRDKKAAVEHEKWLAKMGIGKKKVDYRYDMPDYNTGARMTSDKVAGNGTAKERKVYTGNEIAGVVVTHKSNLMPVRKDNKQAFVDAAQMRRN